jgi:hypothetical protein
MRKVIYVYNPELLSVQPDLTDQDKKGLIEEYCISVGENLEDMGFLVDVRWSEVDAQTQSLDTELREALKVALPMAVKETETVFFGALRFVQVSRAFQEIRKQATVLALYAPHLAYKIGSLRVKIAEILSPGVKKSPQIENFRFLESSRDSAFILWAVIDYQQDDADLENLATARLVYLEVEQKLYGASFYYPLTVWSHLVKDDKAMMQVGPIIPASDD